MNVTGTRSSATTLRAHRHLLERKTMKSTLIATALAAATLSAPGWACSICRCGDPTFNALGKEGVAQTGLRVALDWDEVEKTQGPVDERDSLREQRTTLLLAYGLSDRFGVFVRVPL